MVMNGIKNHLTFQNLLLDGMMKNLAMMIGMILDLKIGRGWLEVPQLFA